VGIRAALAHRDIEPANGAHSRYIGQMIMVVFDGLSVTPDIQAMIEKYYVGNILLTMRNIRGTFSCTHDSLICWLMWFPDAVQVATLTQELQKIAQAAGFRYPLMIGIEQENGMVCEFCCATRLRCNVAHRSVGSATGHERRIFRARWRSARHGHRTRRSTSRKPLRPSSPPSA
jgi:hypothetical protein